MASVTDLDLRLLRVFMAVARAGSFTAAQAVLNVSQSTVSNHMAALEDRLGYRLCQRGRVGFALTEKGKAIFDQAERLFSAIDDFESASASLKGELAGELRIGLSDNMVSDPASPVAETFRRFSARKHSVFVGLSIQPPHDLQHAVLDGRLHAAVGSFARTVSGLNHHHLYDESNGFYCGRGHALFEGGSDGMSVECLGQYRVVARGYWQLEDMYRLGLRRADATVDEMEALLVLVLSGGYLGFLPDHYAAPWVARGDLRQIFRGRLCHTARFDVITRKGMAPSPVLGAFLADLAAVRGAPLTVEEDHLPLPA
ncbi:LysR family transcriptional regulator [Zavarzinia sp.]|uniref:LysR family transcriptional regulator n=1 Tax=Zavarzinia sp. TaxID=2027920 RepID=UPI00356A2669